ncbi:hypothetical protein G210_2499 [Candida maltosa Xu316]|uniref:BAR domain-containing protein n=1 Tax=Candida maltosa (strain Xu316) TaxID=1245528 RepID=M3JXQ7_CANMX|nr:hypothetical protein G210_2499 [Candida maltosa Xu316]
MVVDKLKNNITQLSTSIGTHIKDGYKYTESELTHLSYNIKDTVTFHKRDYDKDDELIEIYHHDLKQSMSGLKYIISQNHHLSKQFLPHMLSMNMKIVKNFINLIGPNSLYFDGINDYYHAFDDWQATQEIPHVHPKEMQFLNDSVNEELYNYLVTVENLKFNLEMQWEDHDESIKIRVGEMKKFLKKANKLISKRDRKRTDQDHLHRRIEKMKQKSVPFDEKDEAKLKKLEDEFETVNTTFTKYNKRCLELLPTIVSLLDEFIEGITKMILFQQLESYQLLSDTFEYFSVFYGFVEKAAPESYQQIIDEWEQSNTKTRLRIESFVGIIRDKNPELIDQEINDEDPSSKYYKFWRNMNNKIIEKKHIVKPKDKSSGIFNDTLEIDPLIAFATYDDPSMNLSETYHPHKYLSQDDVTIPPVTKTKGPELPPRSNMALVKKPEVYATPLAPISPSQMYIIPRDDIDDGSEDSVFLSDDNGTVDESVLSDTSSVSSVSSTPTTTYNNKETADVKLRKIYNGSKNDIKKAPITAKPVTNPALVVDNPITMTYKLSLL